MKILHITNTLEQGGVESLLFDLLPEMKSKGHEVAILVLSKSKCSLKKDFEEKGIRVLVTPYSSLYNLLNIFLIWKYVGQFDIIHSHLFPTQYYVAIAHALCGKKCRFYTTEHSHTNRRRTILIFRTIEQWVYRQYDGVIAMSDLAARNLSLWINRNCTLIYNGVDFNKFHASISEINLNDFGIDKTKKRVVMTARFYEAKDHVTAIKAMALLSPDIVLLFIGSGTTIKYCQDLVTKMSLNDRVYFCGQQKNIVPFLKLADVCLLATNYEGFPISILEYMAAQKPIVASDVPGVDNLVKDIGLLYKHKDDFDLSVKIKKMIDNPLLAAELAQKGFLKVKEYSSNITTEKYLIEYGGV